MNKSISFLSAFVTIVLAVSLSLVSKSAQAESMNVHITVDGATLSSQANAQSDRRCHNLNANSWRIVVWDAQSHANRSTSTTFNAALSMDMSTPFSIVVESHGCQITWNPTLSAASNGITSILVGGRELSSHHMAMLNNSIEGSWFMVAMPTPRPSAPATIIATR